MRRDLNPYAAPEQLGGRPPPLEERKASWWRRGIALLCGLLLVPTGLFAILGFVIKTVDEESAGTDDYWVFAWVLSGVICWLWAIPRLWGGRSYGVRLVVLPFALFIGAAFVVGMIEGIMEL